ncbi:MerR family transcriptional regulator [Aquirufa sp. ROCK2-A2]
MNQYSIKDLENLSGIKAHTLRIWEQRYGILNPNRSDTNIRTYCDKDLKFVLNIAILQDKGGYKISEISKMDEEQISQHILQLSENKLDYPDQIQALTVAMLDLDESLFRKLTDNIVHNIGFESYVLEIIYPFLGRLGTLWLSGSVGPAQEHFITHLIRQKLIAAIDQQDLSIKPNAKKFLLYLPEGELHELGLLFANYILRARKHSVIYLGQSLPFDELIFADNIHQPDYICSVFTTEPKASEIDEYLSDLAEKMPNTKFLLSGYLLSQDDRNLNLPSNLEVLKNFQQLITIADSL